MKKILLAPLFFFLPICTFAEKKISIGLSGGVAPHSLPLNNKSTFNSAFLKNTKDVHEYLSCNVLYTFLDKYQLGLQVAATTINYKINAGRINLAQFNVKSTTHFSGDPFRIANPAIPVTILFNRILNSNAIRFYTGVEAGYERYLMSDPNRTSISGILGGIHIGATYDLSRVIKLNANIAMDYHNSHTDNIHYEILSFPLTIGLIF